MQTYTGHQLGQYNLVKLIGRGGFADVYEAYDRFLKRRVAIKVLHARFTQETFHTFLREAQTLARLDHPHIVKVIEFNIHGNIPYLVMDLATGTLHQRHSVGEQLSLNAILEYLWQIADALEYIHHFEGGLVHLDIKPENMLIGEDGRILLNDFGIATFLKTRLQRTKKCVGTVYYMAPECFGRKASAASDQYALAIVVFTWLTGDYPFDGTSGEIMWQHIHATPPSLRTICPDIPLAVEQVVLQAMAKDPQDRFESVREFVATLDAARHVTSLPDLSSSSSFVEFIRAKMRFILGSLNFFSFLSLPSILR